jgi:hypothetical protein
MAHGLAHGAVHGGLTTMAGHRAQWNSAKWPLRGAAALPLEGKMEGRRGAAGGLLTEAWTAARRQRTGGGAPAQSSVDVGMIDRRG